MRDRYEKSWDEVLSLSKLKTLEYRLFRKMREKLRNYLSMKSNATIDQSIQRFIKESKELTLGLELPHPLEFYIDICVEAFDSISHGPKKD